MINRVSARADVTVTRRFVHPGFTAKGIASMARAKLPEELLELYSSACELDFAFPLIHRDTASAPLGGVMPRFEGTWTLLVDRIPLVVAPTAKTEGTVFLSKWKAIVEDINLKLEPALKQGGPMGPWDRLPGH